MTYPLDGNEAANKAAEAATLEQVRQIIHQRRDEVIIWLTLKVDLLIFLFFSRNS